jgi:predicted RNase H-like HicB family nuclease
MINDYLIVIEQTPSGYSAYSPDVPGCIATGKTKEEVEHEIHEALEFHFEGLRNEGLPIPTPSAYSSRVRIAA